MGVRNGNTHIPKFPSFFFKLVVANTNDKMRNRRKGGKSEGKRDGGVFLFF